MPRSFDPATRSGSRFIVLATTCVAVAALYFLRDVFIPLALAILFTFLLAPVVARLQRLGLGRVGSVLLVVLVLFSALGGLGWIVGGQVVQLGEELPNYQDDIVAKIKRLRPGKEGIVEKLSRTAEQVQQELDQPATGPTTQPSDIIAGEVAGRTGTPRVRSQETVEQQVNAGLPPTTQWTKENPLPVGVVEPSASPLETLGSYLGIVLGPLGTAGLVIVFVLFMLLQREDLRDRMIRLLGHGHLNITTQALDDAGSRISRYLLAQAIVNGTYGMAITLGLWGIGFTVGDKIFPNAILWGLLCAILRFIPYIGPWIAAAFPLLVAFAVYKGFGVFFATAGLFVVIELLSNNLMEPWLYGSSTGMSAVAVLVAAVFWTFLWGPVGLLLSTPLTVCLVVLGKYVPQMQFLDILLGDEPVLEPHQRLYQRLLALDEEEATDVATDYLEEMSLERVYDTVLMPALSLAEQDRHRGRLDPQRQQFVRRVMKDLIEELADRQRNMNLSEQARQMRADAAALVKEAQGSTAERLPVPQPAPTGSNGGAASAGPASAGIGSGIVARLAAVGSGAMAKAAEIATGSAAAAPEETPAARSHLPQECIVNVACLPAHDEADEIVCLMLVQLLELQGYCATAASVTALASEMMEHVEKTSAQLVCVSAMPPAAVTHARYLCKRVHQRFPELKMVVGLWTWKGDLKKAADRITCETSVTVHTTLHDALDQLEQLTQPLLLPAEQSATPAEQGAGAAGQSAASADRSPAPAT